MLFYTINILYYFASNGTNSNYTLFEGSAACIKTEHNYIKSASSFSVVLKDFLMIIIKNNVMWNIIPGTSHMHLSLFRLAIHSLNDTALLVEWLLFSLALIFIYLFWKTAESSCLVGKEWLKNVTFSIKRVAQILWV